jgi:glutaredoxin 3
MPLLEIYGSASCPYTREMREWLEWQGRSFTEYDVEADAEARQRWQTLAGPHAPVPVLVEDGRVIQTGWQGRSCIVGRSSGA